MNQRATHGTVRWWFAVVLVVTVVIGGSVGYTLLGLSPLDALYQTVTTITTVGFREVEPFGPAEQAFTIAVIVCGVGTVLYTFTLGVQMVVEGRVGKYVKGGAGWMVGSLEWRPRHRLRVGPGRPGRRARRAAIQ